MASAFFSLLCTATRLKFRIEKVAEMTAIPRI